MQTFYFDWSGRRGLHILPEHGDDVDTRFPDLDSWLDTLTEPTRLIGEATFESFNLVARRRVIERVDREGHELLCTPTRLTGRTRRTMGYDDKSDEIDVFVIRHIAQSRVHLRKPRWLQPDDSSLVKQAEARTKLRDLRNTGTRTPRARSRGFNFHSNKDAYAEDIIERLPLYKSLTETQQAALGNGKGYSKIIVSAVAIAAEQSSSRDEFEWISGLFAHGYPTQIRADLHWWGLRLTNNRARKGQGPAITTSEWRREIRWLYHQIKQIPDISSNDFLQAA